MTTATHAPLLVLLVGVPGSGKSTFASDLCSAAAAVTEWSRISQDALGTRKRCIRAAEAALLKGHPVIIDRCNFDPEQRAHWLQLPSIKGAPHGTCAAVFLDTPMDVAYERVLARPAHEGGVDSTKMSAQKMRSIVRVSRAGTGTVDT